MKIAAREVWLKDGEKLTLRSPDPTEAEILLTYLRLVFRESYRNLNQTADFWDTFPVEKEREILRGFTNDPDRFLLSAFNHEGRIVANLGCVGEAKPFQAHNGVIGMGVIEAYRGRGLGTQLMQTAKFEAPKCGFTRLQLNVRTFNREGIALYEKVGFKRCGHLEKASRIDHEYFDEYIYEMVLETDSSSV